MADETMFDSDRGTPATGNRPSIDVEGELSALSFNRGWANSIGTVYFKHPAVNAGQQLVTALKAAGIRVPRHIKVTAGRTPQSATTMAGVHSPTMAALVSLTNTPSDNFFAETLVKDLGARFGTGGTTAAGAAVVRAQIASSLNIRPRLNDGSGLSRSDLTTPVQVVTLLENMASNSVFTSSLAVAGETGTLEHEMRGTMAQGRCRGKTGTLHDVSNVVGYCQAEDGHTLAYALMMNGIVPDYAHPDPGPDAGGAGQVRRLTAQPSRPAAPAGPPRQARRPRASRPGRAWNPRSRRPPRQSVLRDTGAGDAALRQRGSARWPAPA